MFLKIYISVESIIVDVISDLILHSIKEEYTEEDDKINKNKELKLKEECIYIYFESIINKWNELFESKSPYTKLNLFYEINLLITEELFKQSKKYQGADEIFPLLVHSILLTNNKKLYSEYMYLKILYNDDIYNNIFEFLMVKYTATIRYLLK